ncbi:MAG: hypothetical protein U9R43_16625 [Thermodesulfobacteriota bacterium]|nr:hypothetical protein [Thermodesulfobacteriota bacterium]
MKKLSAFTMFILFLFVCFTAYGFCEINKEAIEHLQNGHINWTTGIVQAKGVGTPLKKSSGNASVSSMKILSDSKNNARHNMMKTIQNVRINSVKKAGNYATINNSVAKQLEEIIYKARENEKMRKYMSDGTVEVYLQLNLYGGFAQLFLPEEIKQIEPIKQVAIGGKKAFSQPSKTSDLKNYTGLVVDATCISVNPAMAPRLLDEDGKEVYGTAFASREFAVQKGMSGYSKDFKTAKISSRVGNNPLSVKGLRTTGPGNCDIVISNADASILRSSSEHLAFLKKCNVIIVLD